MHGSLVEARYWRVNVLALWGGTEDESLSESVRVSLYANFLTVADDIIGAEDVRFLNTNNFENGTVDRTDTLV